MWTRKAPMAPGLPVVHARAADRGSKPVDHRASVDGTAAIVVVTPQPWTGADYAQRHRPRRYLPRLRVARSREPYSNAQRDPRRRPPDPHARARALLPQGAPAAPRARRQLLQDRSGLHEDCHHLDRYPSREPGVPRVDRRTVALPLRPGAERPEGPRNPGVHRPGARPDDPPHPRAQARAGHPQHLQRLLVLGTSLLRGSLARPTDRDPRDPPRLGSKQARAARSVGCGRLLAISRMGQALPSVDAVVLQFLTQRPRARPDDPAHARTEARPGHLRHLQRLLLLGAPLGGGSPPWPAGRLARDPPRLRPQHLRAARGVGRRRPLALPWLGVSARALGSRVLLCSVTGAAGGQAAR